MRDALKRLVWPFVEAPVRRVGPLLRPTPVRLLEGRDARVLLFSMREVEDLVASCAIYEFEDAISEMTGADRVEPLGLERLDLFRKVYKAARLATGSAERAARLAPAPGGVRLHRDYDLFLPVFAHAHEVFALDAVPDWRERCRFAACYISETWADRIPDYLLERLARFDRIYLGVVEPVETVARLSGRPCTYLPLATDALRFCPWPDPPARAIDVCGIGRRSPVTHEALLALAREQGIFYYHDTIRAKGVRDANAQRQITFSVASPSEHRFLIANLLQRSRYFIANRARVNEPEVTRGVEEISGRFFEGAAAGTVMIGAPPHTETFRRHFGWPDAVVEAPPDIPDIADRLAALDADPARLARIRKDNVVNSLLRHDWAYRLRTVLEDAGLAPPPGLAARELRLRALAQQVRAAPDEPELIRRRAGRGARAAAT